MSDGTRTVAVLFTDLVDSTMLSQRLDVPSGDRLRAGHFALLRTEVEAAGGTVVKNLGDGLMVVFDVASAALSCAVAMLQAVDRDNRVAADPVAIRVGVAFGEVTESDGDFFGDPVVEAARLCASASGGQILATDVVRVVAGRRVTQDLVTVGPLALKGIAEPVACVEVRWEPVGVEDATVPFPNRLQERSGSGWFVGRGQELSCLGDVLKEASGERHRRLVLVGGEPGIGKTTLAAVFARSAHAEGAVVLYGRCDDDLGIPYQAWGEAIGHLVHQAPPGMLDEVLAAHGADLAHLGFELAGAGWGRNGGSEDAESARYLLFRAILRVLGAVGASCPVVVVLDDLQWADAPTLQVLRVLLSSDQALPVVVVGTFRESEVGSGVPLSEFLALSHRETGVTRLSLRGLDDSELLALMEMAAGHAIDDAGLGLRDALSRETDGNPFFVFELLRHLSETGAVYHDADGRWTTTGEVGDRGLPVSVREVIGRRAARLGAEAVRVLSVAAVIGRDFDVALLASASDTEEEAVLDLLDGAVGATLVVNVHGLRYSFVHALVGHALYDGLSPARRARAHRRVAESIEETCGPDPGARVGELAYHWAQATAPQDADKAIGFARAAGDRALAGLAPDEALRWYRQALGLLSGQPADDTGLRTLLLVGEGTAQRQMGDPAFRETLLEAGRLAQQAGDVEALVAAVLANNRGMFSAIGHVDVPRIQMIEAALAATAGAETTARARLLALLAGERNWDGDYQSRHVIANQAMALARRLGDPATLVHVLLQCHNTIWGPDTLAERAEMTAEAEALADRVGDPVARFWTAIYRSCPAIEAGDLAEFIRCRERYSSLANEVGQPMLRWMACWFDTIHALLAGDVEAAQVLAAQGLEIGTQSGQPDALLVYGGGINSVLQHQGRVAETVDVLAAMVADNPGLPFVHATLARVYADVGRLDEARQLFAAGKAADFQLPIDPALLCGLVVWAEVAAHLADEEAAAELYERLSPWEGQVVFNGNSVYGSVAHYLGILATLLARYDTAQAHFERAQGIHDRLRAPYHQARTHLEWGRMLLGRARADDRLQARAHLDTAHDIGGRYGCGLIEQRAIELLYQC
jgi:class 3 adenylate cyclase/tetratricopeptide (TPR) repeat protein